MPGILEDLGGKYLNLATPVAPPVRFDPGLAAGLFKERLDVPFVLRRDLWQENPGPADRSDVDPVDTDANPVDLGSLDDDHGSHYGDLEFQLGKLGGYDG